MHYFLLLVTYMLPQSVYVLFTLVTQILTAVIAEPGRGTVPGCSAVLTTLTTLLEHPLHGPSALDLSEFPLH